MYCDQCCTSTWLTNIFKIQMMTLSRSFLKCVVSIVVLLSILQPLICARRPKVDVDEVRRLTQSFAKSLGNYEFHSHTYYAGTTVQLFLQILADLHENPKSYYHQPEHLDMILRSLEYSVDKLTQHRRHADRPFEVHAIGTASCGIMAGLHPVSVAGRTLFWLFFSCLFMAIANLFLVFFDSITY